MCLVRVQNEDIDVALDNCSGMAFAEVINAYLESQGQSKSKVAKIEVRDKHVAHDDSDSHVPQIIVVYRLFWFPP